MSLSKSMLYLLLLLFIMLLVGLVLLAKKSQIAPKLGVTQGQFQPCEYASNCINSMLDEHEAIPLDNMATQWARVPSIIKQLGGQLVSSEGHYLRANFHSKWLGFEDDLELLLDEERSLIHLRAASRVGRSDFGVNRKRINALREQLLVQTK